MAERETVHRKLTHLVAAIEDGAATTALVAAMRTREAESAQLDGEIAEAEWATSANV